MSYAVPNDLPLVDIEWWDWTLAERIKAAIHRIDVPGWARLSAVAITMVEQPRQIPVGNCAGIMPFRRAFPWGWSAKTWKIRPVGYAMIREGMTGKKAPFLAFEKPGDSLSFLIDRCCGRKIRTGDEYAAKWVGLKPTDAAFAGVVKNYTAVYDKVATEMQEMVGKT